MFESLGFPQRSERNRVNSSVHFGILVPNFGDYCGSLGGLAELAVDAESSGWDGFFIFDHIQYSFNERVPLVDPWIALATIAVNTKRVRIGPLVTPIARRRPWKLARETTSIDHLSNGRLTLGVGLGDPVDVEFTSLGENSEDRIRAAKLDEGLQVLVGLWSGEPFTFLGKHYQVRNVLFLPRPLQSPRIPIWVAGRWPRKEPFLRAAQWDGAFPLGLAQGSRLNPDEIRMVFSFIRTHRGDSSSYDIVTTSGANGQVDDEEMLRAYAAAGATWWMEDMREWRNSGQELRRRIRNGPPRI
jgi:alkanesulfonate monooxygenase SsuD/methylene tetrahydromethanopterin reductase-like flavin-dependent oxidoreductase (luciferase family)